MRDNSGSNKLRSKRARLQGKGMVERVVSEDWIDDSSLPSQDRAKVSLITRGLLVRWLRQRAGKQAPKKAPKGMRTGDTGQSPAWQRTSSMSRAKLVGSLNTQLTRLTVRDHMPSPWLSISIMCVSCSVSCVMSPWAPRRSSVCHAKAPGEGGFRCGSSSSFPS